LRCRTFCDKEGRDRRQKEWILEHAVAEGVIKCLTVIHLICACNGGGYRNAPLGERDCGCKVLMVRTLNCGMRNANGGGRDAARHE